MNVTQQSSKFRRHFACYRFCQHSVLWSACRAALVALTLSGCASLPQINAGGEVLAQLTHAIDTAQTYKGAASDRCYEEGDSITGHIIGARPSHAGVVAWGFGYAAVHYGIYKLLAEHDHDWLAAGWEAVTIGTNARAIGNNISVGVRLGSHNLDIGCASAMHGDVLLHPSVRR